MNVEQHQMVTERQTKPPNLNPPVGNVSYIHCLLFAIQPQYAHFIIPL